MPAFGREGRDKFYPRRKHKKRVSYEASVSDRLHNAISEISELKLWNAYWRRENKTLMGDVQNLLTWKEKALDQLTSFAPLRDRAKKELKKANLWRQQLKSLEQHIGQRMSLESSACAAQKHGKELQLVIETQTRRVKECEESKKCLEVRCRESQAQFHALQDLFGQHLQHLVDTQVAMQNAPDADVIEIPWKKGDGDVGNDELMEGFQAVSAQCVSYFRDLQLRTTKAAQASHVDLQRLTEALNQMRERLASSECDNQAYRARCEAAEDAARASQSKTRLLQENLVVCKERVHTRIHAQMEMMDRLRTFMKEVNEYLKLVKTEIRRKFGYLPESITHVDEWDHVVGSLHELEKLHCRYATLSCYAH